MKIKSPKILKSLLGYLLKYRHPDSVLADYEEECYQIAGTKGIITAKLWLLFQIIIVIPSFIKNSIFWSVMMFRSNLKTALRNIKRHKSFSFINIAGLTIGMTCFVLIILYVQFELSFDNFQKNGDRIFRIYKHRPRAYKGNNYFVSLPAPLARAMKADFPEVINATQISGNPRNYLFSYNNEKYNETGIYADNEFLKIFSFPLLKGDKQTALAEPNSIVISDKMAAKIFGNKNPLGKNLLLPGSDQNLRITGVFENIPENSHIGFEFIISLKTQESRWNISGWGGHSWNVYVLLQKDYPYKELEKKLPEFLDRREAKKTYGEYKCFLQPLREIHLRSNFNFDYVIQTDITNIYLFSSIAVVILLIACINYMNLSTAMSALRVKEIGMRKVVGAEQKQLIKQFLSESVITSGIALLFAVLLLKLILPYFNSFIEKNLELEFLGLGGFFVFLIVTGVFTGLFSGIYPAVFLSSFQSVKVLKGQIAGSAKSSQFRNILVITQFSISIILITCTIIIFNQLKYIKNANAGYNKEHVVIVPLEDRGLSQNAEILRDKIALNHNVSGISVSNALPLNISQRNDVHVKNEDGEEIILSTYHGGVDYNFTDVFEIELVKGRNFSKEYSTDSANAVIINETAVNQLGWKNPIGKNFQLNGKNETVIGVVKDFHFFSFHLQIKPMALSLIKNWVQYLSIRIKPDNIPGTIAFIKENVENFSKDRPFTYHFLDDLFDRRYRSEQKLGSIFTLFSLLAIFIACLGLYGLAFYSAERRIKEIGIRKVLGASISRIVLLLNIGFIKCLFIAYIIAVPAAWYAMDRWLQNFAYKTDIGWIPFTGAVVIAVLLSVVTVSYQVFKAATANPVESLRNE